MLPEILPLVENACNFKEESSNMDSICTVEKLSNSLQSCEPFSVTDNNPCKSLAVPDISGADSLVGPFDFISMVEPSGNRDDEGKDEVKFDDSSKINWSETICSSPSNRSVHLSKSDQKTETMKAARKCGKKVVDKPQLDMILLGVVRKRRSHVLKPVRSYVWGSMGCITKIFEQNTSVDVPQNAPKISKNARGVRVSGRRKKNQTAGNSQMSKGKTIASTCTIRLKLRLSKEVGQSCQPNFVTDNGLCNHQDTSIQLPKIIHDNENSMKEKVDSQCWNQYQEKMVTPLDSSHLDLCLANKDLENLLFYQMSSGVTTDDHQKVSYQREVKGSGTAVDSRCLDSETSPDSEVINLIPEAQVNGKGQEHLADAQIYSQDCVASGDVTNLNLPQMTAKKGKKMDSHFRVEDESTSPETINKANILEKQGHVERQGNGFYSSDASILTTIANMSGNTSSSEGFFGETLPSSGICDFGVSHMNWKVENGTEGDPCIRHGVELESPDSHVSEKLLLYTKTKGQKHLKSSSKSRGLSRIGSEVSDSSKGQRRNACRQKGNPVKSVNKRKVKDKGACDEILYKGENYLETGDQSSDNPWESKTGNGSSNKDMLELDMTSKGAGNQYLSPGNAWVRCDDCFKWRRISATLADSIEETNCKWTCKDNMDKSFADCSIPQEKSNSEINAELEISDASCEEDASDHHWCSKRMEAKHSTVHQQSSWRLINSNLFLHRSRKTQTIDEIMVCHCKPPLDGRIGCGDGCLNRMLNIECVQGTCPCGERCSNQQFQKRQYAKLKWFRCGKKGYGLQLLQDISKGQFLIEYVGEVLDMLAYQARQRDYASEGHKHFYFMTLNGSEVIDACAKGNLGRFINHSCDPNCRTEKWMVNGEVCIGLFALRDIKKGEEVTFDYNYVRVFGAAAKKCVCGSSHCRGYIGGDPLKTEVIVQGDSDEEYPEPIMVYEDGNIDDNLKILISSTSSFDETEMQAADHVLGNKDKMDKSVYAFGQLESTIELQTAGICVKDESETEKSTSDVQHAEVSTEDSLNKSASTARLQMSLETCNSMETLAPSSQQQETYSHVDDVSSKPISDTQHEFVWRPETSVRSVFSSKLFSDAIDSKKKGKSDAIEDRRTSKSRPLMYTSRSSSSVKKGKSSSNFMNSEKPDMINKSHVLPHKSKKIVESSLSSRFEAVEEKLNELLDSDGGISKRKDAPKGYLKLLLLTAASGDSGNGEGIQSNRDLSMILDALLKTKSRMVLVDIISKNGLQMLHNIMKRYRRDFNKIPILRKLLKVLEYLAVRGILTLEHINGGPPCPGVESFRESILILTEHDDKQVHHIARNFRDRWIPRPARKISCNRNFAPQSPWSDQGVKTSGVTNSIKQPIVATNSVDVGLLNGCSSSCSAGCSTNGIKMRKRKSRWDQPADTNTDMKSPQHKEPKIQPSLFEKSLPGSQPEIGGVVLEQINGLNGEDQRNLCQHMENPADDGSQNMDEDVPPGFFPRSSFSVPSSACPTVSDIHQENCIPAISSCKVVIGHPNGTLISRQAVSYGIPLPVVQQFGTPQAENLESWVVAPGIPFNPFPPLPPYPRDWRGPPPCAGNPVTKNRSAENSERGNHHAAFSYPDQNTSTSGPCQSYVQSPGAYNQHGFQQARGMYNLGRRYFRQQKWNNSKLPPWLWKRNGCRFMGNDLRNGMCSPGVMTMGNVNIGPKSSEDVSTGMERTCSTFTQFPQQQN
ncbi:histone-lysine N-methyltransferase ASHH2 [Diospyros lotus]|uniref:histone-lysine N-methyltransferase ASHH2 n=1 Tax=Diospyros lotus TaxID=55363 RepID=UPI002259631A|nr:histone-lysine N-methyltransferase ASHH2 [Diospyros lotus]XP_052202819.1 histone-lysine N-methyltransferase ASHH2 [Diospyros lotus]